MPTRHLGGIGRFGELCGVVWSVHRRRHRHHILMPTQRIDQTPDARKGCHDTLTISLAEDRRNSDDNVGGIGRIVLRDGVEIDDPLAVAIGFLETYGRLDVGDPSAPAWFSEPDL